MKILLINSAEPHIREFVAPIEEIVKQAGKSHQLLEYRQLINHPIEKYSGVIISGSPQGDDIIESHQPYFQWIKNFNKPILGICAGHHIIGYMYGSVIYSSKEIEKGEIDIEIKSDVPIFKGYHRRFKGHAMHNDSISVPEGFEIIASTSVCNNQAMKKVDKEWYTLQFHPEIANHKIIENFLNLVEKQL